MWTSILDLTSEQAKQSETQTCNLNSSKLGTKGHLFLALMFVEDQLSLHTNPRLHRQEAPNSLKGRESMYQIQAKVAAMEQ